MVGKESIFITELDRATLWKLMRCDEDEIVIDKQGKEVIGLIVCFHDFRLLHDFCLHIEFILMLSNFITLLFVL